MKKYDDIHEVWLDLTKGKTIYSGHKGYKVYVESANCKYQDDHFTNKAGKVLSIRCIENYFGGLMNTSELGTLFSE